MKPRNIFLATLKKKAGLPMDEPAVPILEKAGIPIERDDRGYIYVKGEDEGRAIEALRLRGNFGAAAAGGPVPPVVAPSAPPPDEELIHFDLVREIKTGRKFLAEYSREAAEWYEKGTGKAYSIDEIEVLEHYALRPGVAVAKDAARVEMTPEIRATLNDRTKTKKVPLAPILEQLEQEKKPEGPAVDFEALKEQPILIHRGNCAGPMGCLESDEALHYFREEDLVTELRRRGWAVSCTKSI